VLRERLITDVQRLGARHPCVIATMDILDRLEERDIQGDFCECGVWQGTQPILAKAYVEGKGYRPRKYWCYDTFSGMPPCMIVTSSTVLVGQPFALLGTP